MSEINILHCVGKWNHSSGGEIEISHDAANNKVIITHPTVGKQTLEMSKFIVNGETLDYFGFKGKLEGPERSHGITRWFGQNLDKYNFATLASVQHSHQC